MQFKYFTLLAAAVTSAYAQTVSFNATQIIQTLEDLTNLADVTNSIAGSITAGNLVTTVPQLVTALTGYATALITDAVDIAKDASGSVFDTTDQVAICTSVNNFIGAEQRLVSSISGLANIITVSPFNAIITGLLNSAQATANGIVNSLRPSVPNCVTTGTL